MKAMIVSRAKKADVILSLDRPRSSVSIARKRLILLRNVVSLRTRRTEKIIRMVRPLLFLVLGILVIQEIVWWSLPVVFLVMMNGYLIQRVHFISALTEIGSVLINLCRMEM
jgi:hypothetical protein